MELDHLEKPYNNNVKVDHSVCLANNIALVLCQKLNVDYATAMRCARGAPI